ncbi:hypothetical protein O3M35_009101 [Rhynocoris fuscipes]|uniref:Coiled-coil domain-containing protein 13 n=1 Tax=Rhynocoris fuscipes TaxID=488301 RepID=A0AAW1D1R5_9HEMI
MFPGLSQQNISDLSDITSTPEFLDFDDDDDDESDDEASKLEEVTRRIKSLSAPPNKTFFPDEVNADLKEEVKALKCENTRLKRCIQELETQLNIKNNAEVPKSLRGLNTSSDIASGKIVELAKKVRELNAKLASTENRANKAENELKILQKEKAQIKDKVEELENEKEKENEGEKEEKIKELSEKLSSANKKLFESKNEVQQLKLELKMANKVLASEVGDEVAVHNAMTNSGWRGRAQQILSLEKKVSELTEKLSHTNVEAIEKSVLNLANSERQADKEKINTLKKELDEMKNELAQLNSKHDAAKARIRVLSSSLSESKGKVEALTYKTNQDEQMIARLSNQINEMSDRQREREEMHYKNHKEKITALEIEISQEKVKSQQLKEIIDERESRIARLEEKCSTFNSTGCFNGELSELRPQSRASSFDRPSSVSSTSETERIRLMELVTVLNRRIEEERKNLDKAQEELRKEKRKGVKLENKLAKLELGKVGSVVKGYQQKMGSNKYSAAEYEALSDKCELLEEKCLALESRLETMRMEKEEETRIYQNLLDEVRSNCRDQLRLSTAKSSSLP